MNNKLILESQIQKLINVQLILSMEKKISQALEFLEL